MKFNKLKSLEKFCVEIISPRNWYGEIRYYFWRSYYVFLDVFWYFNSLKKLKWFYQRGKRGYADCDVWSFDIYLCKVIGNGVEQLRKTTHGYPPEVTEKKWDKILSQISSGFLNYLKEDENIDLKEPIQAHIKRMKIAKKNLDKSLKLMSEHFLGLWD